MRPSQLAPNGSGPSRRQDEQGDATNLFGNFTLLGPVRRCVVLPFIFFSAEPRFRFTFDTATCPWDLATKAGARTTRAPSEARNHCGGGRWEQPAKSRGDERRDSCILTSTPS